MTRVAVFIDYQNTYMSAREVFGDPAGDPFTFGQFFPRRLALRLRNMGEAVDSQRELTAVRVYRGEPDAQRSPQGQAACQRQVHHWNQQALVTAITRPLRYRPVGWSTDGRRKWEAREKGIDVLIALDMLKGAVRDRFDVAVLVSADTDLVPAAEAVIEEGKRVEFAAWRPDRGFASRLTVPNRSTWCHMLDRADFLAVEDPTDYTRPFGKPPSEP